MDSDEEKKKEVTCEISVFREAKMTNYSNLTILNLVVSFITNKHYFIYFIEVHSFCLQF